VKAITLTRRQQIDRRLQNAQEGHCAGRTARERARDEFWATWRELLEDNASSKEEKNAGKKEGVAVIRDKEDAG
jgi:hypothetical protein